MPRLQTVIDGKDAMQMKEYQKNFIALLLPLCATVACGLEFETRKAISYHPEEVLAKEGDYARERCLLDLKWPVGVSNFATVVNFHGGGLEHGARSMPPWPQEARDKDPVAFVAGGYRLITNATPAQAISDAAAVVAWTLKNISRYGGDPKKVFVTGVSAGGYLSAMVGMDGRWLAPHGFKPTDLAGIAPLTGQMTKHFNVRKIGFKDTDAQFMPKIDEWAPLYYASAKSLPPSCFLTGGRDIEWKARVEENELLAASIKACGHSNCEFHETEGNHGGGVRPSGYFLRDFVLKTCDTGAVARFADGERIVFFGDSITHSGRWHSYLQLFWNTRYPGSGVRIMNCGIGGDTASGSLARIDVDLLEMKPDRVFVMFGMNDVYILDYGTEKLAEDTLKRCRERNARYAASQRKIANILAEKGVKTVFVTPSPYDQYSSVAKTNMVSANSSGLALLAEEVRNIAAERNLGLVELHKPLTEMFKARKDKPFCTDRVHPNAEGHMIMAAIVLDTMCVNPYVAHVAIDAKSGKVYRPNDRRHKDGKGRKIDDTINATVTQVAVRKDGIAFTYAPKAIPFPAIKPYLDAESTYPLTKKLNREIFRIENLAEGTYELFFDGTKAGEFTAEAFAAGVNVALLDTPNSKRAMAAAELADELHVRCCAWRSLINIEKRILRNRKVDPADHAAADTSLDKWLSELKSRNGNISYYKKNVENYRKNRAVKAELEAAIDDVYARLDAVRPAVSRVVLKLKK